MTGRARLSTTARNDLTPRQREVIALMAAGKTNAQIAESLGITLEGAKYHVSEILAKLGVESREEAVAAWQSGRPGWRWPSARILLPAAGIAAVAIGAVLALALLGEDEPAASGEPEVWLAWVPQSNTNGSLPLHIVRGSDPDAEVRRFDDLQYGLPAWSGDGDRLAAWAADPSPERGFQLVVFARDDWSRRSVPFEGDGAPGRLFWSPHGDVLAHTGPDAVTLYSPDLDVLRTVAYPSPATPSNRFAAWSPNSQRFVLAARGTLSVVSREGNVQPVELPDGIALDPRTLLSGTGRSGLSWESDDTFVLLIRLKAAPEATRSRSLNAGRSSGTATPGSVGAFSQAPDIPSPACHRLVKSEASTRAAQLTGSPPYSR